MVMCKHIRGADCRLDIFIVYSLLPTWNCLNILTKHGVRKFLPNLLCVLYVLFCMFTLFVIALTTLLNKYTTHTLTMCLKGIYNEHLKNNRST